MPVVEAMASGTPVVCSNHSSLDEAAGDAAVRVDPEDPQSIGKAIDEARERRDELVAKGLEHARRFTWRATGEALLRGYREAA
jgi:glycosyltransferase involved in cell wall biosynthesis